MKKTGFDSHFCIKLVTQQHLRFRYSSYNYNQLATFKKDIGIFFPNPWFRIQIAYSKETELELRKNTFRK